MLGVEPAERASNSSRGRRHGATGEGAVGAKLPGTTTVCPVASLRTRS